MATMQSIIALCVCPYTQPYDRYELLFAYIALEQMHPNSKPVRPDTWWPVARALCLLLYSQTPADDTVTIYARGLLVQAIQTVWFIIYTNVYDIVPPCAWTNPGASHSTTLHIPVEFTPSRCILKLFERLTMFRTLIHNGIGPTIAASLIFHLYCLQPRNIHIDSHQKAAQHLASMVRDCTRGGKFWIAHYMEPYYEWDIVLRGYRQTNDRSGI